MTNDATVLMIRVEVGNVGVGLHVDACDEGTYFLSSHDVNDVETAVFDGPRESVSVSDHVPGHEVLLDFLIERALAAWIRSQG